MNNGELLEKVEEKFKRRIGVLVEHHEKEIATVAEGHSILLRKVNEVRSDVQEMKNVIEKRLDRHDK